MADPRLLPGTGLNRAQDINVLNIKGTHEQMGFQHGFYLADKISLMVNHTLLATAAYVAAQTGTDPLTATKMLMKGMEAARPYFPTDQMQEIKAIAQGVQAAGVTDVKLEQLLLWNTNYDQWCIYCHPDYWDCGIKTPTATPPQAGPSGGGCSSFCAWDEWAGGDGKLVFGKNEDNFNMPEQLENRIMVVADPDKGHGHVFMSYPGMIGLDGGFNEVGLEMMTQLSSMQFESMKGCGIATFTRLILSHASTVDEATTILKEHRRCAGIAFHVADAKRKQAAVVETSYKRVCVRHPMPGIKAMWQTNHSNCYPGWMGYSGYNMVADQAPVNKIKDISTVEAWQESLKEPYNFFVQAPSRFERYRQLIHQYYGNITDDNALNILRDHFDPYTAMTRPKHFPSWTNNILCTICAEYPDFTYQAQPPVGTFKAHVANMWSMIAWPETGDFLIAADNFPAQYGSYKRFNLLRLLGRPGPA